MVQESLFHKIKDYIGFLFVKLLFFLTKYIKLEIVSTFCGYFAVIFSPFIPTTYTAYKNLTKIYKNISFFQKIKIIIKLWYHLGLFAGEFAFVYSMDKIQFDKYIYCNENFKKIIDEIKQNKYGTIIYSAHFSNWEFALRFLAEQNLKINVIYRKSNNLLIEENYIKGLREKFNIKMIAKQDNAAFKILKALINNEVAIILTDQRDDKGELINFIGKKAYTNLGVATLALKNNSKIYGFRVVREKNKFEIKYDNDDFIDIEKINKLNINTKEKIHIIAEQINDNISKWVNKNPEQWFWVHNRWKNKEKE